MKFRISLFVMIMMYNIVIAQSNDQATLTPAYKSNIVWNGVTTTDDGRVFVCFPRLEGDQGIRVAELMKDGKIEAYPDITWNSWKNGDLTGQKIVRANSLRIGPDGNLWIVDTGAPKLGDRSLPNASKLIVIDVHTDKVIRVIGLAGVMKENSFIDDLRIYGSRIYLTDAGAPAIIVMDRASGKGRRVLENQPSTTDNIPILAEGKVMKTGNGSDLHINADQLEISPDGKYLYFQPASGKMSRIETVFLNDRHLKSDQLNKKVINWLNTPSTGGTAIDALGNIYLSDVNHCSILRISPKGKTDVLIHDPRLLWADALWIDKNGFLWMPCGQLNRLAAFQGGKSKVQLPVFIFKLKINAQPFKS